MANIKSLDQKALLEHCLLQKEWAQKELYDIYSSELFAICCRYATDNSEAKDILQEGFIKIFTNLKQYRSEGTLIGWLKRVMVTTCLNYIKKHKREFTKDFTQTYDSIGLYEDNTTSYIDTKEILQAFMQLPYRYRAIVGMHIIEGYTYKELSKIFGIEEVSCRTRIHRGKIMLKEIIQLENNAIAINK